ncbi:MAG: hypothetical protein ACK5UG_00685 [Synechococcaceae cyanobacterium]
MLEERGRGAVLVGVARVDAALESLLQAVLLPSPSGRDALFQPDRPLGSFGAKISLANRLGLIDRPVERALHTLRRLRNAFAHSSESAALTDPAHASGLAEAYREAQANPLWSPLQQALQNARGAGDQPLDPALRDYILLITILVAFLEATAQQLRPLPFCKPEEDPFLLLESSLRAVQEILVRRRGLPLRRSWIEQPYGEEEIALLEEEVLPVLQRALLRVA